MIVITVINVNIRKLHEDAIIPRYATSGAAVFDLVSVADVIIAPGETALVPIGLAFEIPVGYEMDIRPRSGITLNTKLRVGNAPATVDSDFRGEVNVIIDNTGTKDVFIAGSSSGHLVPIASTGITYDVTGVDSGVKGNLNGTYLIHKGDRIAQAIVQRIPHVEFTLVDVLSETGRGDGGFGSSGVKSEVNAE